MERKITIEEKTFYQEDYQMRMLRANHLEELLDVRGRGMDGSSYYEYDVSGKVSVKAMFERGKIRGEDVKNLLQSLRRAIERTEEYLLNIHHLLLDPEYIFYEDGSYYFCYYPPLEQDLWEAFHLLTEYLVKQADYTDSECVRMVFLLHKETMEDNYDLDKLICECISSCQEESKEKEPGQESASQEYDTSEHDWIAEQEKGSLILKETENMWRPVKRFLNRHRKQKWGDFDGLHIEEEEL